MRYAIFGQIAFAALIAGGGCCAGRNEAPRVAMERPTPATRSLADELLTEDPVPSTEPTTRPLGAVLRTGMTYQQVYAALYVPPPSPFSTGPSLTFMPGPLNSHVELYRSQLYPDRVVYVIYRTTEIEPGDFKFRLAEWRLDPAERWPSLFPERFGK